MMNGLFTLSWVAFYFSCPVASSSCLRLGQESSCFCFDRPFCFFPSEEIKPKTTPDVVIFMFVALRRDGVAAPERCLLLPAVVGQRTVLKCFDIFSCFCDGWCVRRAE